MKNKEFFTITKEQKTSFSVLVGMCGITIFCYLMWILFSDIKLLDTGMKGLNELPEPVIYDNFGVLVIGMCIVAILIISALRISDLD